MSDDHPTNGTPHAPPFQRQVLHSLPLIGPIPIGPSPVPTNVNVGKIDGPQGEPLIILQFATPQGVQMFFLDEPVTRSLLSLLEAAVGAGIVTVRGVPSLPPRPRG